MKENVGVLLMSLVFIAGCATTSFEEAKVSQPHAILRFQEFAKIGSALDVVEINGQEPNPYKWTYHRFTVSPGIIVVLVGANQLPSDKEVSDMIKLNVEAGHTYYFSREIEANTVIFRVLKDDKDVVYSNTVNMR